MSRCRICGEHIRYQSVMENAPAPACLECHYLQIARQRERRDMDEARRKDAEKRK